MNWVLKPFASLSPLELYAALRLRNEVFVVEQNCVFQDADNYDPACHHLLGFAQGTLIAYTRLVPPGIIYPEASIGRVVTAPAARRTGAGKALMEASIHAVYELFGRGSIKIGAQCYLQKFYEGFGFCAVGGPYLEDGIPHITMVKLPGTSTK